MALLGFDMSSSLENQGNQDAGQTSQSPAGNESKIDLKSNVVFATWAPADPRDRLYSASATKAEKSISLYRIIAAFHPVLNLPVVTYDLIRLVGVRKVVAVLAVLIAMISAFLLVQS